MEAGTGSIKQKCVLRTASKVLFSELKQLRLAYYTEAMWFET